MSSEDNLKIDQLIEPIVQVAKQLELLNTNIQKYLEIEEMQAETDQRIWEQANVIAESLKAKSAGTTYIQDLPEFDWTREEN